MNKIGIGIIGCSNRIFSLLDRMPELNQQFEIRALCDPDNGQVETYKKAFCPNADVYNSDLELVKADDISWVVVGSWNSLHASQAAMALKAGKHVFCEKPLATSLHDAVELQQEYQRANKKLMVGFTLRYSTLYKRIKEIINSGRIGDVISFEFNETLDFNHGGHIMSCWRRKEEFTGSHILEKCCHDIDLANWLVDSVPIKVASFGGLDFFTPENDHHMTRLKPDDQGRKPFCSWYPEKYHNPFISDKNIIDNQVVILQYQNGIKATFHTNLCAGLPERRFYILGTEGAVRFDLIKGEVELRRIGFDEEVELVRGIDEHDGHGGGDKYLVDYWLKMMVEDAPALTTLEDGLMSAVTCFAIEDARKNEQVVNLQAYWEKLAN